MYALSRIIQINANHVTDIVPKKKLKLTFCNSVSIWVSLDEWNASVEKNLRIPIFSTKS